MKDSVMRFGRYKGMRFKSIPHDYLLWVLDNCKLEIVDQVEIQGIIPTKTLLNHYSKNKRRIPKKNKITKADR